MVEPGEELDFLRPLPGRCAVGRRSGDAGQARAAGIATVGDLADSPFGRAGCEPRRGERRRTCTLWPTRVTTRAVVPDQDPKSISHEETFSRDLVEHGAAAARDPAHER